MFNNASHVIPLMVQIVEETGTENILIKLFTYTEGAIIRSERSDSPYNRSVLAVVREKLEGKLTTKEIMDKYHIKNKSQVETWIRWYKKGEIYRLDQPIGKQYTFGH